MTGEPLFCHFPSLPPPVRVRLPYTQEHDCPYLPERLAWSRAFWADQIPPELYHAFMDANFRRSGCVLYQPVCRSCRACRQIRVPTATFSPSKSQKRSRRRNVDIAVTGGAPRLTDEKFELYAAYVTRWHGKQDVSIAELESFLYSSPVQTIEHEYRNAAGKLVGVGICDVSPRSFSSVYFYHDPGESARSLGTFAVLQEIDEARRMEIPHYYLGFWIDGCQAMEYKASFRPNEILGHDGVWRSGFN